MIDCRYAPEHLEILTAEEDIDFYHQVFLKIDENNRIIILTMVIGQNFYPILTST